MTIKEIMVEANANAKGKGFWEEPVRTFGDQVALMHSELSEALEEFRNEGMNPMAFLWTGTLRDDETNTTIFVFQEGRKPEGIAAEFADVIIRIADTCQHYGIPLEEAIKAKMKYNSTRPHKHGGKVI